MASPLFGINSARLGVRMLFVDVSEAHLELAGKRDIYPDNA